MKELGYFQIYLYTQYANRWDVVDRIVNSFLNQKGVSGYSYNLYFGGAEPLAHVTVRFNFENDELGKKNVEKIIEELINEKTIITKGEWASFETSPSVERATEAASKCAFAFQKLDEQKYGRNEEIF